MGVANWKAEGLWLRDHQCCTRAIGAGFPIVAAGLTVGFMIVTLYKVAMAALSGLAVFLTLGLYDKARENFIYYSKEAAAGAVLSICCAAATMGSLALGILIIAKPKEAAQFLIDGPPPRQGS